MSQLLNAIAELDKTNNTFTATTDILLPDLTIFKRATPDSVSVGEQITYQLIVRNSGDGNASNIRVEDTLPEGFIIDRVISGGSFTANKDGQTVTFMGGDLDSGHLATFTISSTVGETTANPLENTAIIDPLNAIAESDETNNTFTTTTRVRASQSPLTKGTENRYQIIIRG